MTEPRNIAILGSTGSIGEQALEVVRRQAEHLKVTVLTAGTRAEALIAQAKEFVPDAVVIGDEGKYPLVKEALANLPIKVFAGADALADVVEVGETDMVLTALVGFAGLQPTLRAIRAGKAIALANKETLVVAGEQVTHEARAHRVPILPVDSEHSAIFQCLTGEVANPIEMLTLTASGGPFRGYAAKQLEQVTLEQALKHPNWSMGAKITIDSATMMNKGLEVIEAYWLFGVQKSQIDVIVHPQSIIHSMVRFRDGSIKAQMGLPDMRLPIQYALMYPQRGENEYPRFDFTKYPSLTFESVDTSVFRNLGLAFGAMKQGGNAPCILNAANEVAVAAFLSRKIRFTDIMALNERALESISYQASPTIDDLLAADAETRRVISEEIKASA